MSSEGSPLERTPDQVVRGGAIRAGTAWRLSVIGFALASALLVGIGWIAFRRIADLREATRRVEHTLLVRAEAAGLLSLLIDAETGQRGFLITGAAPYLEPYETALASLPQRLDRLRRLTRDNPRQQASLATLDGLIQWKLGELRETIVVRQRDGSGAAARRVQAGEGKQVMDDIRGVVGAIGAEEKRLLAEREAMEERQARFAFVTSLGGLAAAIGLLLTATLLMARAVAQRERERAGRTAAEAIAAALAQSEERLRVTITSIGDAVIATDTEGRVTQMNPVAQALTGWTAGEAIGKPLEDVFVIINEQTRRPVENPVHRVLREGVISGLANHTLLVTKDGREIPIDDSAAPIRTARAEIVGVVLIFRDITARRRMERERAALLEKERAARAEAERVGEELRHLQAVTDIALANVEPDALMRELLRRVRAALASDTATILLVDPDGRYLTPVASDGLPEEIGQDIRIPLGRGVAGQIAMSERAIIFDDLSRVEIISPLLRERVTSLIGVPLKIGERLLGVVHAGVSASRRFTEADVFLLSLVAERLALAIDRANLHEAERAARREAETGAEQLRLALEAGRMGTWQYTLGTGAVTWSPGLEAIHGFSPGSLPGTFAAFRNEIHPDDRDRVREAIGAAVEQRRDHQIEYRIVRSDGTVRWVEARGQLFCDPGGRPERMVGVCLDVTERKHAEEKFRLAVEAAPAAVIMVDPRGTIVLANALTEQLLGYARHEIVGQSIERLVPPRFRDRHLQYRRGFFAEPRQRPMGAGRDLYALRKDGSEVPVEIGLSPLDTADGRFVLAAITDITERKRTAAALEDAVRARDDFLSIASHELRNPVNAVHLQLSGVLRALQRDADPVTPEWLRDRVGQANVQFGRLTRLLDNLLDVSRITTGSIGLEPADVDFREILQAVVDQFRGELTPGQLTLRSPQVPVVGHWDRLRLEQVVANLLSNAIKYGGGAPIEVSVDGDDLMARLSVTDRGIGIDEEHQKRLFGRFERAVSGLHYGGLGLGLWITRQIVEAMQGRISVESRPGRGSTFSVVVPVRPSRGAPMKAASAWAREGFGAEEAP